MAEMKISIFSEWLIFSLKKFQISEFHPVFCLLRKEMGFLTCSISFRSISCKYFFFLNGDLKYFQVTTPYPRTLTAYPSPVLGVPPLFFIKMTAKDVKEITLMAGITLFCVLVQSATDRPPPPED